MVDKGRTRSAALRALRLDLFLMAIESRSRWIPQQHVSLFSLRLAGQIVLGAQLLDEIVVARAEQQDRPPERRNDFRMGFPFHRIRAENDVIRDRCFLVRVHT